MRSRDVLLSANSRFDGQREGYVCHPLFEVALQSLSFGVSGSEIREIKGKGLKGECDRRKVRGSSRSQKLK